MKGDEPTTRCDAPLLSAEKLLAWQRSLGRRVVEVPAGILLTHQAAYFRELSRGLLRRRSRGLLVQVVHLDRDRRVGAAGGFGVGGAATAMAVDELAALGARNLIAVDVCGSLSEDLPSGRVLVVSSAIVADGTARHYGADAEAASDEGLGERLEEALAAQGIAAIHGKVWSTDAPYRETRGLIEHHRERGAMAVDMECAALFAAAAAHGIKAAAVLVAGDLLWGAWSPPGDDALVQRPLRASGGAALECLRA